MQLDNRSQMKVGINSPFIKSFESEGTTPSSIIHFLKIRLDYIFYKIIIFFDFKFINHFYQNNQKNGKIKNKRGKLRQIWQQQQPSSPKRK
jgi:hypothetical protein